MASRRKSGTSLSPGQQRAAGLLVAGLSNEEIAATLGIHPCTIAHWKGDPQFRQYLELLLAQANERIVDRLVKSSTKALDTLEQMIEDPKLSWMQKLTVAGRILEALNAG